MEVQLGLLLLNLKVEIGCKELRSSLMAFNCRLDVTQRDFLPIHPSCDQDWDVESKGSGIVVRMSLIKEG